MSPLIVNGRSEKELILGCQNGDIWAQRDLFNIYGGKMLAICVRYTRSRAEAEDLLQDVFIKIFNHIGEFKFLGSFEGWMRRILINQALKNIKKKSYRFEIEEIENAPEESILPSVFAHLNEEELLKIIAELPEGYQIVFNLFAIEGWSHKEIAEHLHIEESTSRSQLAKARKILQSKISHLYQWAV